MKKIPVIAVVGPTATGKTKLSIRIAKKLDGEIVSADSMQIYKGMDIGTAKPAEAEKEGIPHHLIDIIPMEEEFNVSRFVSLAGEKIADILGRGKTPILAGGTGLYVSSLLNGIEFIEAENDYTYRISLQKIAEEKGEVPLREMLFEIDRGSAERINKNDIKRLIRALEVYKTTGLTMTQWNKKSREKESVYQPTLIALNYKNRSTLYERINRRVDMMTESGLEEEVRGLIAQGLLQTKTATGAIGYKEMAEYIIGKISQSDAIETIKRETRRYAKRQITWWRKDERVNWIEMDDSEEFESVVKKAFSIIEKKNNL